LKHGAQWVATENSYGEKVMDLEGTNAALYEIEGGSDFPVAGTSCFSGKTLQKHKTRKPGQDYMISESCR
jgi:hypothetical protein